MCNVLSFQYQMSGCIRSFLRGNAIETIYDLWDPCKGGGVRIPWTLPPLGSVDAPVVKKKENEKRIHSHMRESTFNNTVAKLQNNLGQPYKSFDTSYY